MFIGLLSAVEKFFSFFEPRGKPCFGLFGTTFKLGGGRGYRGIRVEQRGTRHLFHSYAQIYVYICIKVIILASVAYMYIYFSRYGRYLDLCSLHFSSFSIYYINVIGIYATKRITYKVTCNNYILHSRVQVCISMRTSRRFIPAQNIYLPGNLSCRVLIYFKLR